MEDLKLIVAKNISELRVKSKMTQLDLAEKLSYTDKAVSKWERGESLPDITVLKTIADLFGVTVDYLLEEEHTAKPTKKDYKEGMLRARGIITSLSILLVWFIATLLFVIFQLGAPNIKGEWLVFIYALPVSSIVWLVLNSIWFNRKVNYVIISFMVWTLLVSVHLNFIIFNINIWPIYILGIPGEIITIVWSKMKK